MASERTDKAKNRSVDLVVCEGMASQRKLNVKLPDNADVDSYADPVAAAMAELAVNPAVWHKTRGKKKAHGASSGTGKGEELATDILALVEAHPASTSGKFVGVS